MITTSEWALFDNVVGDEELLIFFEAAQQIQGRRQMSMGVAQRALRDLCASGDVRSWKGFQDIMSDERDWMSPTPIKPKDWKDQPDLEPDTEDGKETIVYVSSSDLEYWFDPKAVEQPVWNILHSDDKQLIDKFREIPEIRSELDRLQEMSDNQLKIRRNLYRIRVLEKKIEAEKLSSSGAGGEEKPALGKRPRIKALLGQFYPNGVPDPGLCNRQGLQSQLLKADPTVAPLDLKTLKTAIDEYNAGRR